MSLPWRELKLPCFMGTAGGSATNMQCSRVLHVDVALQDCNAGTWAYHKDSIEDKVVSDGSSDAITHGEVA